MYSKTALLSTKSENSCSANIGLSKVVVREVPLNTDDLRLVFAIFMEIWIIDLMWPDPDRTENRVSVTCVLHILTCKTQD